VRGIPSERSSFYDDETLEEHGVRDLILLVLGLLVLPGPKVFRI
jgi:hypothetical protein